MTQEMNSIAGSCLCHSDTCTKEMMSSARGWRRDFSDISNMLHTKVSVCNGVLLFKISCSPRLVAATCSCMCEIPNSVSGHCWYGTFFVWHMRCDRDRNVSTRHLPKPRRTQVVLGSFCWYTNQNRMIVNCDLFAGELHFKSLISKNYKTV